MITTVPALLFPLVLAAAAAPPAGTSAATPVPNVAMTLIVGRIGAGAEDSQKTYKMLGQAGSTTSILMGWKMPIPTRSGEGGDATTYVYQNIGVSADMIPTIAPDGRFLVEGEIEISGTREPRGDAAKATKGPLIGTFQQALHVVLPRGKRVRVAEAPDPETGTLYLDLEVNLAD
jgi:hypothetical protein